jgi:peptide/nickel transport system substrate-binding protein
VKSLATAVVLVLLCASGSAGAAVRAGGVYRVGIAPSFTFTDDLDPTGESYFLGQAILSQLLVRTLVGYDHVPGAAGLRLVPDLATAVPSPTDGGKTYTFHLKAGVRFGPPVDRVLTSQDVRYALERLANPKDGGQQAIVFNRIVGWNAYAAGKTEAISGISTPNAATIVFHLMQPMGDFLYQLTSAAAAPLPREVAGCFEGRPGAYGRDLVSTGPYMIEGADKVDASSCSKLKPMSGFDGQTSLTLVRNPSYDPATDSKAERQNLPDEFEFTVDSNVLDLVQRVEAGELDDEVSLAMPPQDLERYKRDPKLHRFLKVDPVLGTEWIMMNLTQPPFDDVHVRRALSWVLDKTAIRQAAGGPLAGKVAAGILPELMSGGALSGYDPYRTPGSDGSAARAKSAMRGSKYDTQRDGMCSAAVCKNVLLLTDTSASAPGIAAVLQQDAAKIGITLTVRSINGPYPVLQTVRKQIPLADFTGLATGEPDPFGMLEPGFDSRSIIPVGNFDWSLIGVKPAECKAMHITGDCASYDPKTGLGVPSVNAMIDRCRVLVGGPRRSCWVAAEKYLMTQAVPVIPYLWVSVQHIVGRHVARWVYDASSATTSFVHVALG